MDAKKIVPSEEQKLIVACNDQRIIVNAGAGAAKSTTAILYAQARPTQRILYLAYNKSIAQEAQTKFPKNVKVLTTHAPAYNAVGKYFVDKMGASIRPYTIIQALGLNRMPGLSRPAIAAYSQRILDAVNNFLASTDADIDESHVKIQYANPIERTFQASDIARHARTIWDRMTDPDDSTIPMLHDGYLKIFMLEGLRIGNYDRILFDEAQDANPVALQILLNQNTPFLMVGDNNQAIYTFRGAVDAMKQIEDATRFKLSGSFRFGNDIAFAVNRILHLAEADANIRGVGAPGEVFLQEDVGAWRHGVSGQFMYLARGAFELLAEAILQAKDGKKMLFIGGASGYRFSRVDDVYALKFGGEIKDPFIKHFEDYDMLVEYAKADFDMGALCRIVDTYGQELPVLLKLIEQHTVEDQSSADVIFSTVHKAKGLEHDTVVMAEDFYCLSNEAVYDEKGQRRPVENPEELNIAYVAATRARKRLFLPQVATKIYQDADITRRTVAHCGLGEHYDMEDAASAQELPVPPASAREEHRMARRGRAL